MAEHRYRYTKAILRQTADSDSFRYIVETRHLHEAADYIEHLEAENAKLREQQRELVELVRESGDIL